jgi:hypothetical protein
MSDDIQLLLEALSLPIDDNMEWQITLSNKRAYVHLYTVSQGQFGHEYHDLMGSGNDKMLPIAMSKAWTHWQEGTLHANEET